MRRLPLTFFLIFCTTCTIPATHAQPPEGSKLPPEQNGCALCHGESRMWQGEQQRLLVTADSLAEDVHWLTGVNCHDCHGGDPATLDVDQAHNRDRAAGLQVPFRSLAEAKDSCAVCHEPELLQLRMSVHAYADKETESSVGRMLSCDKCHGEQTHGMLAVNDPRSPVHLDHQVRLCGSCHEEDLASYSQTVHGKGLLKSGLVISATCASCHGSHGIFYAADKRSTLHSTKVDATCGQCHQGIGERLRQSVHGGGNGIGQELAAEPGQKWKRNPNCTDCHQGHRLLQPSSGEFRRDLSNRCGNCHPDLTGSYAMSTHGELTQLGYAPAAKCSDCHGSHDILPLGDPNSPLASGANRLATCRQCHTTAVMNFSQFDPHANHKNAEQYPTLHFIYAFTQGLFLGFFLFFIIHGFFWFVRSFVSVLRGGRHRTLVAGQYVVVKHKPLNRFIYITLLVSFLGLTITGLPLKYSSQRWAQVFVETMGGFESTSVWHRFFGLVSIFCCVLHLVTIFHGIRERRQQQVSWRQILFGPDSPIPGLRDAKDLFGMVRWFLGLGPKPSFERWTYWEKWDYWMACLAFLLVGTSGLMMWYPNLFCRFVSGHTLNIARVIHVELALMSTSLLFVFHFFHTHFRPEKFPMDLSALTGWVDEDHLRQQRPSYVARLEETGQLEQMRRPAPSEKHIWLSLMAGVTLFSIGICLLGVALTAALGK